MVTYQASTEIQATAEEVWGRLSSVEAWPQWLPTVTRTEALDGTPMETGKRYRVEQPRLRPAVWTVIAVEPNRRFEWRTRSPGTTMVADHAIEPLQSGAVRVRLTFTFQGLLGTLLGKLFGNLTRQYLEQEAQALEQALASARG